MSAAGDERRCRRRRRRHRAARVPRPGPPLFSSVAEVRDRLAAVGLPRRRRHRRRRPPGRPPGQAGARRGARRHGQDRAGQVGGPGDRQPAHPPAVLRGPRRVQGALRVELQEAAAAHPGPAGASRRRPDGVGAGDGCRRGRGPGARRGATSRRTSSPRSSSSPARCSRPSAPPTPSSCSSTRWTASSSRPRRCCSRCCRSTRCRSPSSGRSGPSRSRSCS